MRAYPWIPGVPSAGHIAGNGYWHPGAIKSCSRCQTEGVQRMDAWLKSETEARAEAERMNREGGLPPDMAAVAVTVPRHSQRGHERGWMVSCEPRSGD